MQHPAAHLVVILCIQLIQKCMWEVYKWSFILFQPALLPMDASYKIFAGKMLQNKDHFPPKIFFNEEEGRKQEAAAAANF